MERTYKDEDAFINMCFSRRFDLAIAMGSKTTSHIIRSKITGDVVLEFNTEAMSVISPCNLYTKTIEDLAGIELKRNRRQFNKETQYDKSYN